MHGITVSGTVCRRERDARSRRATAAASPNNVAGRARAAPSSRAATTTSTTLVKKIQASPLWKNPQKKVAIVLMFDEGNATPDFNSCCGWKAGKTPVDTPLVPGGRHLRRRTPRSPSTRTGNKGHGKSVFGVLTNQPTAPKGIEDNDAYSHFSFVRTLQDMFVLSDPAKDASYMNRSKYTEKFIAQNILNLPEFAGSADTHFDSVRPMNHAFVIPAGYTAEADRPTTRRTPQIGPGREPDERLVHQVT